jgi:hypothetical protein
LSFHIINTSDKFGGNMHCTTSGLVGPGEGGFQTICAGVGGRQDFLNLEGLDLRQVACASAVVGVRTAAGRQQGD